ncbi:major capsid protein [Undibacterium sp. SXout11W]|uniref:major capsid protein n=1 Tax=Undibacterium sp. SXout11W TaxID=3413050 RepID=UPI003BF42A3F
MQFNIYSSIVLANVVAYLPQAQTFFLDRYFQKEQRSQTEMIAFDVEGGARRMAPFVSPLVQGKVVQGKGFATKTFEPAYIKDKRVFDPTKALKRSIGEQIGGTLSPEERTQINLRSELADQIAIATRRLEWMATQALLTGKVLVSGESYAPVVVDYGRNPAHTIVKIAGSKWSDPGVNPLNDLQDWALGLILKNSGAMARDVIMTTDVWEVFRENPFVQKRWNSLNANNAKLALDSVTEVGGVYMGSIDGFNIFVYADWYVDPLDNIEKPMIPAGTVLMCGAQVEGVRAFAAIRDEAAGFQSLPFYPKSWVENDPSVRYLLMQSAPLPYPSRPNASLSATVL